MSVTEHMPKLVLRTNLGSKEQQAQKAKVQADVEAYLANGGTIEVVPTGLSGENLQLKKITRASDGYTRNVFVDKKHSVEPPKVKTGAAAEMQGVQK